MSQGILIRRIKVQILSSLWALFLVLVALSTTVASAQQINPRVKFGDMNCYQTSGKQFYSDGEVDNTALDRQATKIRTIKQGRDFNIFINDSLFKYTSGIEYKGSDGIQRLNILFTQDSPNLLATKTASMLIYNASQRPMVHLIFTEPLMGNGRSFVRTSFYDCD